MKLVGRKGELLKKKKSYNRNVISLSNYFISHEKCLFFYFTDFNPILE